MPYYEYRCEKCGADYWEIRTVEERNDPIKCTATQKIVSDSSPIEIELGECDGDVKIRIGNPPFKFSK